MKSFFSSLFSTVFLLVSLCTATGYSQNQEKYIEGVAAIVGDNIILKSDLSQVVSMTALQQRIDPKNNPQQRDANPGNAKLLWIVFNPRGNCCGSAKH